MNGDANGTNGTNGTSDVYFMGADCGSGSVRVGICDSNGRLLASSVVGKSCSSDLTEPDSHSNRKKF